MVCIRTHLQYHPIALADINECLNDCAPNALCERTSTGHICSCPPGFVGFPTVVCVGKSVKEFCSVQFNHFSKHGHNYNTTLLSRILALLFFSP